MLQFLHHISKTLHDAFTPPQQRKILLFLLAGSACGFLCGFFGTGGGMVLFLVGLFCTDEQPQRLFGTVSAVVALCSVAAVLPHLMATPLSTEQFQVYLLPAAVGGATGAALLPHLPRRLLQHLFAGMLLFAGGVLLYRGLCT